VADIWIVSCFYYALLRNDNKTAIDVLLPLRDNEGMKTFDDIQISRPQLAKAYLAMLQSQLGRPIALFAPRRIGKTYFLHNDLTPIATKEGFLPVYADLWLQRGFPLEAINYALETALDDVTVPSGVVGRIAKTPVKAIAGVQFGEEPQRRPLPEKAELRFDALIVRLSKASGKRVLLMLDEIQALATASNGDAIMASIRAVLSNRKNEVCAVFTGSSQDALSQIMSSVGAPMYQFAQILDFPFLDDKYLQLLIGHFESVHVKKSIGLADLRKAFEYIGYKPELIKDIVKEMSAEGSADVEFALQKFITSEKQTTGWNANFHALPTLEQTLLVALSHGLAPMAKDTLAALTRACGEPVTISKVRAALDRLRKAGVLAKSEGIYLIEDKLFAGYISRSNTLKHVQGDKKKLPTK
jgi:hypothetical protein